MSLIVSSLIWVKKGKFASLPESAGALSSKLPIPDTIEEDGEEVEEEKEEKTTTTASTTTVTEEDAEMDTEDQKIIDKYGLENYDKEDDTHLLSDTYYENPEEDPNLVDMDDDSDIEEAAILDDDLFVLAATTDVDDEFSHLDVHVYEERDANIFCHHDYMLSGFPLALAWMDTHPDTLTTHKTPTGNYVAVGGMEPGIEIWNLDVMDNIEATATLGGYKLEKDPLTGEVTIATNSKKKGKKGSKKPILNPGSHTDSVLSLSWNQTRREILASGSADKTVKLWDVQKQTCLATFSHLHSDKVQAIEWCPTEPSVLLSTGFDKVVSVIDVRSSQTALKWTLPADPECVAWIPQAQYKFLVSLEDGSVKCFDAMKAMNSGNTASNGTNTAQLWTLAAHNKAATSLAINPLFPNLIATGSLDRHVKLWTLSPNPSCLYSKDTDANVYSASFSPDSPFLLGIGTSTGVRVWDTSELATVRRAYLQYNPGAVLPHSEEEVDDDDDLEEIVPPGQGPKASMAKEERKKMKEEEKAEKKKALGKKPVVRMPVKGKKRFAKSKF